MALRRCWLYNLRQRAVDFDRAWEWQRSLRSQRVNDVDGVLPDVLVLLEHRPVYTMGTGAELRHVKFSATADGRPPNGAPLRRIDRGGEVTFHGPGQLVGYPIVNLRQHRRDLRWFLRTLEQVLIDALGELGVSAAREEGLTGVWADGRKLAAIGICASKWVTMHGFALNVNNDLTPFESIVPCGIEGREVGSVQQLSPRPVSVEDARRCVTQSFARHFTLRMEEFEG